MENIDNNSRAPLGRGQKIAAVLLAVFAVAVVGIWMVQFKNSISNKPSTAKNKEKQNLAVNNNSESEAEALKTKDTDADGLNDYDELNIYKTSPYLEDSDSDGFSDKQEIDNGKDPNCPAGRDCYKVGIVEGDKDVVSAGEEEKDSSSLNSLLQQFGASQPQGGTSGGGSAPSSGGVDLEALLGTKLDAATLRELLLQAGMDKKILDKISDAELMKSYGEVSGGNK